MRLTLGVLMVFFLMRAPSGWAQGDSIISTPPPHRVSYAAFIAPAALISYGALTQFVHPLRQLDEHIDSEVGKQWSGRIKVDDYLQYAPVAAVFGLDLCGVKAKHNFRDRAFVTASSYLLMTLTVNAVKYTVEVQRPNGSPEYNSFPSGHTATVFTGAHLLFREYKDVSPWIGVAGYAAATATGVMRIANRKHWLSDVVAGAGTGIMCVEVSYLLLPVFHRVIGAPDHLVVVPVVGNNTYGAGFAYTF